MLENKRHNDLLIKLSQGTISEKEKWKLERASLDDAFLADALEGYYNNPSKHEMPVILKTKTQTIQRVLFRKWIAVAASLLVLFSISFWAINNFDNKELKITAESNDLKPNKTQAPSLSEKAIQPEHKPDVEILEIDEGTTFVEYNQAEVTQEQTSEEEPNRFTPSAKKESSEKSKKATNKARNTRNLKSKTLAENETEISASRKDDIENETELFAADQSSKEKVMALDQIKYIPLQQIKGRVRDMGGIPIANVLFTSLEGKELVTSNDEGLFEMQLQENESIIAKAEGFVSQQVRAKSNLDINLRKAEEPITNPPKRLAEMMSEADLKRHYSRELEKYFRKQKVFQCDETFKQLNKIKVSIDITSDNMISKISFLNEVALPCQMSIENTIRQASFDNVFDGSQEINFDFVLNKL